MAKGFAVSELGQNEVEMFQHIYRSTRLILEEMSLRLERQDPSASTISPMRFYRVRKDVAKELPTHVVETFTGNFEDGSIEVDYLFHHGAGQRIVMGVEHNQSEGHKILSWNVARRMAYRWMCDVVGYAVESWTAEAEDTPISDQLPPRFRHDRKECVYFAIETPTGYWSATVPIKRDENGKPSIPAALPKLVKSISTATSFSIWHSGEQE